VNKIKKLKDFIEKNKLNLITDHIDERYIVYIEGYVIPDDSNNSCGLTEEEAILEFYDMLKGNYIHPFGAPEIKLYTELG